MKIGTKPKMGFQYERAMDKIGNELKTKIFASTRLWIILTENRPSVTNYFRRLQKSLYYENYAYLQRIERHKF